MCFRRREKRSDSSFEISVIFSVGNCSDGGICSSESCSSQSADYPHQISNVSLVWYKSCTLLLTAVAFVGVARDDIQTTLNWSENAKTAVMKRL